MFSIKIFIEKRSVNTLNCRVFLDGKYSFTIIKFHELYAVDCDEAGEITIGKFAVKSISDFIKKKCAGLSSVAAVRQLDGVSFPLEVQKG